MSRLKYGVMVVVAGVVAALMLPATPAAAAVGDITTFTDPEGNVLQPAGIAAGPDDNLWFTNYENGRIGRIDPDDGAITTFADPAGNIASPGGIVAGSDGNLWFASTATHRIGRIDPDDGAITTYVDPAGNVVFPTFIASGPDGNLWFSGGASNQIGRIDPDDGAFTSYADPAGNVAAAGGITVGPDGNLWFTSVGNGRIGRIDPDDGAITTYVDPAGNVENPRYIVAGPDGNLWFTSSANDRIGRIDPDDGAITTYVDPAGNVDHPNDIVAGPDGDLWFTSEFNDRIGRIDPTDGAIVTFADPAGNTNEPLEITVGPDGHLWFTSFSSNRLGKIEPGPAVTVPGAPTAVSALAGDGSVTVTFMPPASDGGSPITGYTATCGGVSDPGLASPIVVGELVNGTPVTCTVHATNAVGDGPESEPSNEVTPLGQQPDGQVKAATVWLGKDVYNSTAAGQTTNTNAKRGVTKTFSVRIENDDSVPSPFVVSGTGGSGQWIVKYKVGSTNVTDAVVAGTYSTPVLDPGVFFNLKVTVKPTLSAPIGAVRATDVTASDGGRSDTVRGTVKVIAG